ncbi:sugar phosphate isomerase/epimerase [Halomicroarcula sp. F13]|uniref:Sugar phosphate isomerase/epimerase n=1 Tax=Haloarcula rubra TaxID=2487747 RepID=A0AAW4PP16_9EURY|nr:sugar phosphate isomerase/epimerase family protein [Halomicroarcula rubra]MBX0322137.1 sugar phosphate isomerase/epimerase [Halomicroarcula rubra]
MVDYGMFYAYWSQNWDADPDELSERIRRASACGFDLLEIHCDALASWTADERADFREHAAEHDVDLSFVTTLSEETDISSADPDVRQRGREQLTEAIELVDEMDGVGLGGITYSAWNPDFDGGLEEKAARTERAIDVWRDLSDVAEEHDVLCTVEVLNRFEQFMLNTAAEARSFVEAVDSPNLQIMLDTFHMNIEEDDMAEAIRTAGDWLGHFHVGENNRRPPKADGNMPWADIGDALDAADYGGPVVMEPFLLPGGDVAPDIGVWRDLAGDDDLDELATESLAFLETALEG